MAAGQNLKGNIMLHLTEEKKYLLMSHIEVVTKQFPPMQACLSAVSMAMALVDLPDNHKLLHMKPGIDQLQALLELANTWITESTGKGKWPNIPPT